MATQWNELLAHWLYVVINSTLQVSVLICLVLGIKAIWGRSLTPRWHYTLWLLVLAKLLLPWGPASPVSLFNLLPQISVDQADPIASRPAPPPPIPSQDIAPLSAEPIPIRAETVALSAPTTPHAALWQSPLLWGLIWLGGALCLTGYIVAGHLSLWRVIASERAVTDQRTLELLEDCRANMGVKTCLGVVASKHIQGPALFGFIRPRLLLPAQLTRQFHAKEMKYIFYHELGHLKRHDIAVGWLVALAQILHWFNPLVWFAFHLMRVDRELACDRLALDYMNNRKETKRYGHTLIRLLETFAQERQLAALAGVSESKVQLRKRIRMIAGFRQREEGLAVWPLVFLGLLIPVVLTTAQPTNTALRRKLGSTALEHELVLSSDGETLSVFQNAILLGTLPGKSQPLRGTLQIGSDLSGNQSWKGLIDEVSVFSKIITVNEMKQLSPGTSPESLPAMPSPNRNAQTGEVTDWPNQAAEHYRTLSQAIDAQQWDRVVRSSQAVHQLVQTLSQALTDKRVTGTRADMLNADTRQTLVQRLRYLLTQLTGLEQAVQTQKHQLAGRLFDYIDTEWEALETTLNLPAPTLPLIDLSQSGDRPGVLNGQQQTFGQGGFGMGGFVGGMSSNGQPNVQSFSFQRSFNMPAGGFQNPQQMQNRMGVQAWMMRAEQGRQMLRMLKESISRGHGHWIGANHMLNRTLAPAQEMYAASKADLSNPPLPSTESQSQRGSPNRLTTQALHQLLPSRQARERVGKLADRANQASAKLSQAVAAQNPSALVSAITALDKSYTLLIESLERDGNLNTRVKMNTRPSSRGRRSR
jgi:beta-lactamase regulating signal transducer with metallopeptidase domain